MCKKTGPMTLCPVIQNMRIVVYNSCSFATNGVYTIRQYDSPPVVYLGWIYCPTSNKIVYIGLEPLPAIGQFRPADNEVVEHDMSVYQSIANMLPNKQSRKRKGAFNNTPVTFGKIGTLKPMPAARAAQEWIKLCDPSKLDCVVDYDMSGIAPGKVSSVSQRGIAGNGKNTMSKYEIWDPLKRKYIGCRTLMDCLDNVERMTGRVFRDDMIAMPERLGLTFTDEQFATKNDYDDDDIVLVSSESRRVVTPPTSRPFGLVSLDGRLE